MNELGTKLKKLRGKRSLREIAEKSGLGFHTCYRAERSGSVKFSTLKTIATALGVTDEDWTSLIISWIKLEVGQDISRIDITPKRAGNTLSNITDKLLELPRRDQEQILKALQRREIMQIIQTFNRLYEQIEEEFKKA